MRSFFSILTLLFIVAGFFIPIAWAGAIVCGGLAVGSSPGGKRADGKAKTGGLLGGLWDTAAIDHKKQKGQLPKDD